MNYKELKEKVGEDKIGLEVPSELLDKKTGDCTFDVFLNGKSTMLSVAGRIINDDCIIDDNAIVYDCEKGIKEEIILKNYL